MSEALPRSLSARPAHVVPPFFCFVLALLLPLLLIPLPKSARQPASTSPPACLRTSLVTRAACCCPAQLSAEKLPVYGGAMRPHLTHCLPARPVVLPVLPAEKLPVYGGAMELMNLEEVGDQVQ